jgi:hypothetical protein
MTADAISEPERRRALVAAEHKALSLFDAIEANGLLKAGRRERDVEHDIYEIALKRFGVEKYWHKRIVRSGPNTLTIAADNPPVRTIDRNDIVYVDLGPVFEDWEADIGRTYVLGDHPGGRLVADLPVIFERVRRHYHAHPDITGLRVRTNACRRCRLGVRREDRRSPDQRVRPCACTWRKDPDADSAGKSGAHAQSR